MVGSIITRCAIWIVLLIILGGVVYSEVYISGVDNTVNATTIYQNDSKVVDVSGGIMEGNLTVATNSTYYLGNSTHWWDTIYANTIYQAGLALDSLFCLLTGCNMTGNINMGTNSIVNATDFNGTGELNIGTVNTGQGDYELYAMNQDVETTDSVTFNNITSTGYFSGQPIDGSIGSGIIWSDDLDNEANLNVSSSGLNVTYPNILVMLSTSDNIITYCNLTSDTITVTDDAHSVYYVNSTCDVNSATFSSYLETDLSPGGYIDLFIVYAKDGVIELLRGSPLATRDVIKTRRAFAHTNHLEILSGMELSEETFPNLSQTVGQYFYVRSILDATAQNTSDGSVMHLTHRTGGNWTHTNITGINLSHCDNTTDLVECPTNVFRRYIFYTIGRNDTADTTTIHQIAPITTDETWNTIAECLNVGEDPVTYTLPDAEQYNAVITYAYCGKRDDSDWDGGWIDLRTATGGFGAIPDTSIFLDVYGTRPLLSNWNQGAYNLTNTDSWFLGKVAWDTIQNKFITAVDDVYIYMDGTTATLNETKLNATIDARENDTTYTAGNKLYLDGTEFNVNDTEINSSIEAYGYSTTTGTVTSVDTDDTYLTGGEITTTGTISFNTTLAGTNLSVNSSDYWDALGTPSDINAADITDDNTYVTVAGDTMSGNLAMGNNNITGVNEISSTLVDTTNLEADNLETNLDGTGYNITADTFLGDWNESSLYVLISELVNLVGNWSADSSAYWNTSNDLDTVIDDDEISEGKIEFSTACPAGNHYYLDGNDLACEADDDTTYTAEENYIYLDGTTFKMNDTVLNTTIDARDTDTNLTEENVEDYVGGMLGGTEDGIDVTYQDETNDIDFTFDCSDVAGAGLACSGEDIIHNDSSSQESIDNSALTFIQDLVLDTYGHITGQTSTAIPTATPSDGDTTHLSTADQIYDYIVSLNYVANAWDSLADMVLTDDYVYVGNSSNEPLGTELPDCDDTSGQHLNYDTTTNAFSCGTSDSKEGDIEGITTAANSGLSGGCTSGTCTLLFNASDVDGTGLTGSGQTLSVTEGGIGDTQLEYDTGQHLTTTSEPTFATINTGQGAYELYAMNQDVQNTSGVKFAGLTLTSPLSVANGGTGASSFTDGSILFGAATGAFEASAQFPAGTTIIGVSEGTNPALVTTYTAHDGYLKHEFGGMEANVAGYTNGLYGVLGGSTADIDNSSEMASVIDDETGTGLMVFSTSPTLVTPTLGAATATTLDTGQGANELYDMDQNVLTTSSPTFQNVTVEGIKLENDATNHRIYDNATCTIICGDTSCLEIC